MSKSKRHPRNGPSPYYGRPNKQLGHKSQGRKHGEMARRAQDSNRHKDCKTKNFLEGNWSAPPRETLVVCSVCST